MIASADRRLAAISKLTRVRVEGSRNMLITVRPRSVGTRLISRCEISSMASVVSRIRSMSAVSRSSIPSRCFIATPPRSPRRPRAGTRRAPCARSGCSCRRSRPGSGSSRCPRSTRVATWMPSGRPKSITASMAARIVRPVNTTSSTSTTPLAEHRERHRVRRGSGRRAATDHVVAVEGDVEARRAGPGPPRELAQACGEHSLGDRHAALDDPDHRDRRSGRGCAPGSRGRCGSPRAGCRRHRGRPARAGL